MSESLSYWSASYALPALPSLDHDLESDVAVIGAGIGGLTCAYLLLKEGKSVVVVDRGPLAGGQTCRTTGHLAYFLDDRLFELEQLFGLEGLKKALQSHKEAIDLIEKICRDENISCDFERVPGHLFNHPDVSEEVLKKEYKAAEQAKIEGIFFGQSSFLFFESKEVLTIPYQAQFHPLKYIEGLTEAIFKNGGKIFKDAHVIEVKGGEPCQILTDKSKRLTSKTAIVATNTPVNNRVIMHTKQAAYRTYVIASFIPKGSVPKGLYYDTLDPYHYVRVFSESEKDLLIVGGEDHKTGQQHPHQASFDRLESWTRERFPMVKNIDFSWSGQIMEPVDSLGFLGKNPLEKNVYIITGDSGNGLTHATLGAQLITQLVMNRASPYATLYDPARKTGSSLGEFAKENLNVGAQYAKWLKPEKISSVSQIPQNSGSIVQRGMEKHAVYRDKKGEIHEFSAVCPHLGCMVAWNDVEKTWDCPCHGSRFGCTGEVIDGPAVSNLKKVENFQKQG